MNHEIIRKSTEFWHTKLSVQGNGSVSESTYCNDSLTEHWKCSCGDVYASKRYALEHLEETFNNED